MRPVIVLATIVAFGWLTGCARNQFRWQQLPALPDREGFASPYAGISGQALIIAGGSNFPDRKPWDGGFKIWYDRVYVLPSMNAVWRDGGQLPHALGYGVSVSIKDGVLCAGGCDAKQHYADVFLLHWTGQRLETSTAPWPALPQACAMMSGALVGDVLYIAGGLESPAATSCLNALWSLDVKHPERGWTSLEPCPGGGRMLAVAGGDGQSFYLFSGARLSAGVDGKPVREYLKDAWRYTPGRGWIRLADLPRAAVAAASPAPLSNDHQLLVISGDDGTRVGFKPETAHPGFPRSVLIYEIEYDRWTAQPGLPFSRATVPAVKWNGDFIIPSGEARPGYRTPEVWSMLLQPGGGAR